MEPLPSTRPPAGLARAGILLGLVAALVAADRATKRLAEVKLAPGERHAFLGDTVRLELAHNTGAFLGLGASLPPELRLQLFTWGVAALVAGALWIAVRPGSSARAATGAALVGAGGLGNLWDRIANGGWVLDFLNLGLGPLRTGIFNVADVALMAGVVLLAWPERRGPEPQPRP